MRSITFQRAVAVDEALAFKADHRDAGRFVAGGTDLLVALREAASDAPVLAVLDITPVEALRGISSDEEETSPRGAGGAMIRVGALATHDEMERSALLMRAARVLSEAAATVGSPQIRRRGTLGGNICTASPCADTLPALLALEARCVCVSRRGSRSVPIDQLVQAPYETSLAPDELVTEVRFAAPGPGSAFLKLGRRQALSISRMSMAVVLHRGADGTLTRARVAAGSVTPTPRRFPVVEALLDGQKPGEALFAAAGTALAQEMLRIVGRRWSAPYKEPVVAAMLRRTLERAAARLP